jgi:hypothetical protein
MVDIDHVRYVCACRLKWIDIINNGESVKGNIIIIIIIMGKWGMGKGREREGKRGKGVLRINDQA